MSVGPSEAIERILGRYCFALAGQIEAQRNAAGGFAEYSHQFPSGVRLNRFGRGPFCTLALSSAESVAGVYAIAVAESVTYIGECMSLSARFGELGYGVITSRNCHLDGQSTNCRVNSRVLIALKAGEVVQVWFHPSTDRKSVEDELRAELRPPWNSEHARRYQSRSAAQRANPAASNVTGFREALETEFRLASLAGRRSIIVRAGDLHRAVGGYPGPGHKMPTLCRIMREVMGPRDRVVASPLRGAGANLLIEYVLPRPSHRGLATQ